MLFLGRVWIGQVGQRVGGGGQAARHLAGRGPLLHSRLGGERVGRWKGLVCEGGPGARGGGASRSVLVERDFVIGSGKGAGGGRCERRGWSWSAGGGASRSVLVGRDCVSGSGTRAGGGDQMLLGRVWIGHDDGGAEARVGGRRQGRSLRRRDRRPGLEGSGPRCRCGDAAVGVHFFGSAVRGRVDGMSSLTATGGCTEIGPRTRVGGSFSRSVPRRRGCV